MTPPSTIEKLGQRIYPQFASVDIFDRVMSESNRPDLKPYFDAERERTRKWWAMICGQNSVPAGVEIAKEGV